MLKEALAPGRLPPGLRIYAVGDVHGCAGRLAALHAMIAADAAAAPHGRVVLLHLGDLVDRGPSSAEALDMLLRPPPAPGIEVAALRGNHEQMMLDACAPGASPAAVELWLANGGGATLGSYGADPARPGWRARVPPAHLALLRRTRPSWAVGGYLFAHAGIRPGVPLERQATGDLLWIREPFLSWSGPLPAVVVHGHTPARAPVVRPNRIGVDTGAYMGGPLTAAVLEADRLRFLAA